MTHAYDLFAPVVRSRDPLTSHDGAAHVQPRRATLADQLYAVYAAHSEGLTDEEAGQYAPHISGAWKRSADLRTTGRIVPTGATRAGTSGVPQRVCRCAS